MHNLWAAILIVGATSQSSDAWVKAGRTLDDVATIYLQKSFSKKSGTFKSMPESMLDSERTISGEFQVGTYRFAYDPPIDEAGRKVDELISVELLDCRRSYFGTLKQTRRLKGKTVAETVNRDADVLMMQLSGPSVDRQLCDLRDGKLPRPLGRAP
jgi:hypothetical protein